MQQDIRADSLPDTAAAAGAGLSGDPDTSQGPPVSEELLVEEISIDGMCGVY
ncbi:MAG: mycofactocin precursor MftA [Streptosporangiaceae bacterium]|jgi:mycofactocin precursor|nr:mycofactocin precursor [Actinomycetota bacterium]